MSDAIDARAPLERGGGESISESKQLPTWRDNLRGVPTVFLRSALFTCADHRKPRKKYDGGLVTSAEGQKIWYRGTELRQHDLTVWLHLVHLLRELPIGEPIVVYPMVLLEGLGWDSSGTGGYERLRSSVARLIEASVCVERPYRTRFRGRLLVGSIEPNAEREYRRLWTLSLEPNLLELFSQGAFTLLDPEERRLLTPLAQWLYGFLSTFQSPYPYKAATIQELCGSTAQSQAGFRRNLVAAYDQLKTNGLIFNFVVDGTAIRPLLRRSRGDAVDGSTPLYD